MVVGFFALFGVFVRPAGPAARRPRRSVCSRDQPCWPRSQGPMLRGGSSSLARLSGRCWPISQTSPIQFRHPWTRCWPRSGHVRHPRNSGIFPTAAMSSSTMADSSVLESRQPRRGWTLQILRRTIDLWHGANRHGLQVTAYRRCHQVLVVCLRDAGCSSACTNLQTLSTSTLRLCL